MTTTTTMTIPLPGTPAESESNLSFDPDGPYPLLVINTTITTSTRFLHPDSFPQWFSTSVALAHNVILRSLNSIWLNAPLLPDGNDNDDDIKAFTGYALACIAFIRAHHDIQEKIVFPRVQQARMGRKGRVDKLDMRPNVVQHINFEQPLKEFKNYLQDVHDGRKQFESWKVLELRAELARRGFVEHLHLEPETLSPEKLYIFSKDELEDLARDIEEHTTDCWKGTHTLFPFVLTHHNKTEAPEWPNIPSSMRWVANHVGIHLHRQYWKFFPYTEDGKDQNYYHDPELSSNSL